MIKLIREFPINFLKLDIIQQIIKRKLVTKTLTPININNDNIFKSNDIIYTLITKNKSFSTENFDMKFKHCNNITQLKNVVNRLFYKYHVPHQHSIIAALKACSRLIDEIDEVKANKYKHSTINSNNDKEIILVNSINEDLKNYWLEIPEEKFYYTVEEVMEVAVKIFERIPTGNKTTRVYNEYIKVFGSAKRTDLAYAIYNCMLTSNTVTVKPDINTYKTLIIACANKMELGRAFATIDRSTISIIKKDYKTDWVQWIKNIAIGMFGAKWITYGYLFFAQDFDLIISTRNVAVIGIGIGAFLTTRLTMITMLKDIVNLAQERKVSRVKLDLNKVTPTELYKMTPQEIRNYMYTFLMRTLLKNGNLNEALIVLHHMANNETPLSKETYNGIIKNLCRMKMSKIALETIEKFQEHGFHPNAETFLPVYQSLKKQGNIEEFIRLHRLMRDKDVLLKG
ncbi:19912_t:CDS:2 [Gigaspora rosea]|nr:19912_t:CDS:2 [Gigaspora rosea]